MILYESKIEYMKFTPLIQLVLLAFLASACGDQHSPTSTALPSGTSSRTAQSISTKTVVHTTVVPTSTSTRVMPTQTASPSPTVTPTPTPTLTPAAAHPASEACFLTYYAPIAFMPDNLRILVRAGSGVQIINLQTMQEDGFLEAPTNLNGPVVALSPDGETLAWGLEDNTIQLIRISDQELLHTLTGHTGPITKLRFSPEVDTLFFSFAGWLGMVWDRNGKQVKAFQPGGAEVVGLGISPDGRYLAYSDINVNNTVFLSSPDGAQKMGTLVEDQMPVFELIFSPDGERLASADDTGIRIWQVEDGKLLYVGKSACP